MYGGQGKLGRGGGGRGGAGKRHSLPSSFPPPPINRQSLGSSGRLPIGGASASRNRGVSAAGANATTCPSSTTEETFSLVTGNALNFAMIIRMVPDLVEEIKRVEDQGGTARIKFDSNAKNPSENVIEVGGKVYRFTWSHETGDLCDIYEERQSGEDGNGLLIESGCAWRKVDLQRTLDESAKNHVKMRSAEADRKHSSRKAIILDHANPSTRDQMKAVAAAETNPWRKGFNQKKEPDFKKRKVEFPAAGGPPKAANKIMLSSTTPAKSRPSVSPLPSPPEHSIIPGSPFGLGNLAKHSTTGQVTTEETALSLEKELPNRATSAVILEKSGPKRHLSAKPTDLQSMLISILSDNPKGMSLKALEKAVGESMPNYARKIEPIIRKIANFEAPGKYILKPEVELGSGKKPASGIGSSPDDASHQTPPSEDNFDCIPAAKIDSTQKTSLQETEKQVKLNADEVIPTLGLDDYSFDIFGDKKNSDNSVKEAGSSSDSGSDSDSDSKSETSDTGSESGSHSKGRSKSKSPVGSGSSSDSESDDSKEGSDEDVDIMTSEDDQETKQKLQASSSPIIWEDSGTVAAENGIAADIQDGGSDLVDIENDTPDNDNMEMTFPANSDVNKESEKYMELHESPMSLVKQPSPGQIAKDSIKHREADRYTKLPKGKHKRSSETNNTFEKPENAKRPKTGGPEARNSLSMESPQNQSINNSQSAQLLRTYGDGPSDSDFQKNHNEQIPGRKPIASNSRLKGYDTVERPNMHGDGFGNNSMDYTERNTNAHGVLPFKKNIFLRGQDEMHHINEKKMLRNPIEDKCQMPPDTHYQKYGEQVGKVKESAQVSKPLTSFSLKDNERTDTDRYPFAIQGRGRTLQRELSELELGEFREPLLEVTPGVEKQIEQNNPLKQSVDRSITDPNKGKPDGRRFLDQGKKSIPILNNQESLVKKKMPGNHTDSPKLGKSQQPDMIVKPRNNEVGGSHDFSVGGGDINIKLAPKNAELSHSLKNGRKLKSNLLTDVNGQQKDTSLTESTEGAGLKRRESSSDENSCSYSKYEKAAPELKGPIKDFSQYQEYVQEYQAKYDSYCSLNKTLEGYRNEFHKLGRELESAKGKDMERYYIILGKLNESYRQCGPRHKRLKKIFIVLHEELKNLKQMIKEYATSFANESISKS
ncbi:uncharacterized protein LOC124933667 [Impatiens glandulifera]|uniref:uncharacterized protein LOC124933667 n=1 Tax=Impatiens glandulifera TaxID=253017 RepID=UPI001FB08A23|nr:uncharacterized protein LOC124933667 [Impatiens glandulifera]